jgi:peroxiredoxin
MFFTPIALALLSLFSPHQSENTNREPVAVESSFSRKIDFSLQDTAGKTYTLADFKGKFVVLDMWASFCRPCVEEVQPTRELLEKYKDKNLVWVYISFDKNRRDWLSFIKKHHLEGIHLTAGNSSERLKRDFQIEGIPFYVWIDEDGRIVEENAPRPSENATKKLKFYLKDKE